MISFKYLDLTSQRNDSLSIVTTQVGTGLGSVAGGAGVTRRGVERRDWLFSSD